MFKVMKSIFYNVKGQCHEIRRGRKIHSQQRKSFKNIPGFFLVLIHNKCSAALCLSLATNEDEEKDWNLKKEIRLTFFQVVPF